MLFDEHHGPSVWERIKAIYNDWKNDLVYICLAILLSGSFYYLVAIWGN